jgi:hypothetical protein
MGGFESKVGPFAAGADLNAPLTRGDLVQWMEHKKSSKYMGLGKHIQPLIALAYSLIFVLIVPILAFVIIIWQRTK